MKKIIFILLLSLFSSVHAVTLEQAQKIYNKIRKDNHVLISPRLKVVDYLIDSEGKMNYNNAATGMPWQYIYITKKMLADSDEHQIAYILGHELGHAKLFHMKSTHKNEYAADAKSKKYLKKTNYDICSGMKFLKRNVDSPSHPSGTKRRSAVGCP